MIPHRVAVAPEAMAHIVSIDDWWRENRLAAPTLFADELADAFGLLEGAPRAGRPYGRTPLPGVRRLLLPRTRYHVYYVVAAA